MKAGYVHGATDDFGFKAVEKPVHVHDLQATILHTLGFDHTKLTYRYAGRDFRLTDVEGNGGPGTAGVTVPNVECASLSVIGAGIVSRSGEW